MMLNGLVDVMPYFPQKRVDSLDLCLIEEKQLAALNGPKNQKPGSHQGQIARWKQ